MDESASVSHKTLRAPLCNSHFHRAPARTMFAIARKLLLFVWCLPTTLGFVLMPDSSSTTSLAAVSLPLLDTHAAHNSQSWTLGRNNRISRVLEHARQHTQHRQKAINELVVVHTAAPATTTRWPVSLPMPLPTLTAAQEAALAAGDIVMQQSNWQGRRTTAFGVQDIKGVDAATIWQVLLDFNAYQQHISTVKYSRSGKAATSGTSSTILASFEVSKFRLPIDCRFEYQPQLNMLQFSLDETSSSNAALQNAKGFWYLQPLGRDTWRIWFLYDAQLSPWLPSFLVDMATAKALPRATTWLRPALQQQHSKLIRVS